jgi:hypothetical protein
VYAQKTAASPPQYEKIPVISLPANEISGGSNSTYHPICRRSRRSQRDLSIGRLGYFLSIAIAREHIEVVCGDDQVSSYVIP